MAEAAAYQCSLDEKDLSKAKKELNEDPKERQGAVAAFREWVEREPWIKTPTDPRFLLAFLRCGKFSQLKARERLWRFMNGFNQIFSGLKNKDPADDDMLKILRETKFFVVLPGLDKHGRKVILGRFGQLDTRGKEYSFAKAMDAAVTFFHSLMLCDEHVQVNGVVVLIDFTNVSFAFVNFVGFDRVRKQGEFLSKALPLRLKGINYYNTGPAFETLMGVLKPILPKKLQDRIKIHGTKLTSVYKEIDMSLLPDDYLPDDYTGPSAGSFDTIIEQNIKDYILEPSRRAALKELYDMKYFVNPEQIKQSDEPQASFRKLNVS